MTKRPIINIEEWKEKEAQGLPIEVRPHYQDLRNEIIQPDSVIVTTQYFLKNWAPILGPTLTLLILRLRMYCYYNKLTKEKRDWCFPTQSTLAEDLGVSYKTIERELQRPLAKLFITREPRYLYSKEQRKRVRSSDIYFVKMDEPLLPDDQKLFERRLEEKYQELSQGHVRARTLVKEPTTEEEQNSPDGQFVRQVNPPVENSSPNGQIVRQICTDKLSVEDVLLRGTLKNVNVNGFKQNSSKQSGPKSEEEGFVRAKINLLAKDLSTEFQDPKSYRYYAKISRAVYEAEGSFELIYRAMSETKDATHRGVIKKTPASYFTDLMKRYCSERGIKLKTA